MNAYELHHINLFDRPHALLVQRGDKRGTPGQLIKHANLARAELGVEIVFVLVSVPAYERKRLIEKKVPFIVPHRQAYLPSGLIDLRERGFSLIQESKKEPAALSTHAQVVLLRLLLHESDQQFDLKSWAGALRISRMTMSRVRRELDAVGLTETKRLTRSLSLRLSGNRSQCWERAQPMLRSPVMSRLHMMRPKPRAAPLLLAGYSALSGLTLLAPDPNPTHAIGTRSLRKAIEMNGFIELPAADESSIVLERWRYDPNLLTLDGTNVDPLSLYLSLRDDPDPRVAQVLESVLQGVAW